MNITFKKNPEQLQLIAKMASKNKSEAEAAREAFAQLLSPALSHVYLQADTTSFMYRDMEYVAGQDPSFPVELFSDVPDGYFNIWSQSMPGGLATNTIYQPIQEVKFTPYTLDTAVSFLSKYAAEVRLPVIAKAMERLVQELLNKTNVIGWNVILAALAQASHSVAGVTSGHVYRSTVSGTFNMDNYNKFMTFFRRLNASYLGGTPTNAPSRPTDIIVSPEVMEQFRAMAYNPINTKGPLGVTPSTAADGVALPEADRKALYQSGGVPSFYGINIQELLELGKNQAYQVLFANYIGATQFPILGTTTADQTFSSATNELVLFVDATKDFAWRAIATDGDNGPVLNLQPDDQFTNRSKKIGMYGGVEEARLTTDSRAIAALVI